MKKWIILLMLIIAFLCLPSHPTVLTMEQEDVEQELIDTTNEQLRDIDFSGLENILDDLQDSTNIFGSTSFREKVEQLLAGEYFVQYDSVFEGIISFITDGFSSVVPIIMMIVLLGVLSTIVTSMNSGKNSGIQQVIGFVCYGAMVVVVLGVMKEVIGITQNLLSVMQNQIEVILPLLLSMLTAIGGVVSVSIYKPIVVLLTSGVMTLFQKVLLPIFVVMFLFTVIGYINPKIKLKGFVDFFSSGFKWILGIVFTLFSGFLTIQGISAGKYDGISIKATKFAVKSYIPIIGGYLSEGLDFVVLSSVLIKNAVGLSGLILLLISILSPIIQLVMLKLGMQLSAGIVEPLGNSQMSSFLATCSKILVYPIALILGMAFMYILTVAMLMCTANVLV